MSRIEITADYDCPHCGAGYTIGDDAPFVDNIEDECAEQCDECKGWFQVRCASVHIEMECIKAKFDRVDQSEDE